MMISWTALSQPSTPDSTRRILIQRWHVERLLQDAIRLKALEVYTATLEQEVAIDNNLIAHLDSAIRIKDQIIYNHSKEAVSWKARFENQKEMTMHERRQKRRWSIGAVVATGLFVWVAVSP